MDKIYEVKLNKESDIPLYQQLGDSICRLIEDGTLQPNSRLPSIRKLAKETGVNNDTVVSAYKYLINKKAAYSQVGSGTFVSPILLDEIPQPLAKENMLDFYENDMDLNSGSIINFSDSSLPQTLFPAEEFKNSFNELLDREMGGAFSSVESQGYMPLREKICTFLTDYGINTYPENIQILSGAQQGIDIVSKAMISYGDVVFTENPTFYGAAGAFISRGCRIVEIPVDDNGPDVSAIENMAKLYKPKFFYSMAYFQTPTGVSCSLPRKRRILELAEKFNFYIIEDDNLYDFNYTRSPLVPYKALDYRNRVIYIKSFSKILMPGLRMGFAVMPNKITQSIMKAKYTTDISTSGVLQKALDLYFSKNTYKKHIDSVIKYTGEQYRNAVKYCDRYLKDKCVYKKPGGGISLWIDTKTDYDIFAKALYEKNVVVSPGKKFIINGSETQYIRLCFTNVTIPKMEVGIRRIGECVEKLRK